MRPDQELDRLAEREPFCRLDERGIPLTTLCRLIEEKGRFPTAQARHHTCQLRQTRSERAAGPSGITEREIRAAASAVNVKYFAADKLSKAFAQEL
jgi:hypothetical protein